MVADNCRLSCQLDALVLLTNRSAKLIRKCCKSGNYGYHFSLGAMMKSDETTGSPRLTAQTIRNDTYTNRYGNQAEIEPIG